MPAAATVESDYVDRAANNRAAPLTAAPSPEILLPAPASRRLHSARLARQFQKTLDQLRAIQAATSKMPLASSNTIRTKEFSGNPAIMALFFQETQWSLRRNV